MGDCRTPGATCDERGTGAHRTHGPDTGGSSARPVGADAPAAVTAGPTLTGWPRSVAWSEFTERESRPPGEQEDAQISSQLERPDDVGVARVNRQFRLASFVVRLYVESSESWVVTAAKTDDLLAHEQGHYDIAGLCARDMVADLRRLRAASPRALERQVLETFRRSTTLANRIDDRYDTETDHSRNRDRQARWDAHLRTSMQTGRRLTAGPG